MIFKVPVFLPNKLWALAGRYDKEAGYAVCDDEVGRPGEYPLDACPQPSLYYRVRIHRDRLCCATKCTPFSLRAS